MTRLGAFQHDMAEALWASAGNARPSGLDAEGERRFRVYRNNVHHGLSEALGAAYPAVRRLVGDPFFKAMARVFIGAHPPRSRSLALFGGELPRFIEGFEPASSLPYLADVARLERAALEALHAADAPPLDAAALTAQAEAADSLVFEPHPATRLVTSRHPIVSLWRAQRQKQADLRVAAAAETALVTRPQYTVIVERLSIAEGAFAAMLLSGGTVAEAFAAACGHDPEFDPVAGWRPLLTGGALQRIAAIAALDEAET